jgi:hypothetical protein
MARLRRELSASGVAFTGEQCPRFPLSFQAAADASDELSTLEALWFEERVEEMEDGFHLPSAELHRLDPAEAAALGLPSEVTELQVTLRTRGFAGGRDFTIEAETRLSASEDSPPLQRYGAVFVHEEALLLATEDAAQLFRLLDAGAPAALADQLLFVADVKRAAERCGARVDRYLANQDVVSPEGIGVDVEVESPDSVRIRPVAEGLDESFPGFEQGPTRSSYSKADGPRRRRMVLGNEARRAVDGVKQRAELKGADVAKFFDNPEAFLPEGIDLGRFSLRVRGLVPRRYNSQPYVRLQPTEKRDWFGLDVEVALSTEIYDPVVGSNADRTDTGGGGETAATPNADGGDGGEPPPHIAPDRYAQLCREVQASGERYQRHGDGWIEIDPEAAGQFLAVWDASTEDENGGRRITEEARDAVEERTRLVLDVISNLEKAEYTEQAESTMALPTLPEYPLPAALRAELMPHQYIGYRWMRFLHEQGFGGLLADDMGLGKTVQVISLLAHLADAGELQPALVVLPVALIENWKRELARFCPRIQKVYVHQGTERYRGTGAPGRMAAYLAQWEVVLTTYETLRRDQLEFGQVDWSVIACDEAQKVKNPTAQATSAVKGMKAKLRLAMTGTPVENGLSELWCIVDWTQPGKLGSQREFRERFERPLQAADTDVARNDLSFQLQSRLTPHYLRRIKSDVLTGLPDKTEDTRFVPLGDRQTRLLGEVVRRVRSGDLIPIAGLQHLLKIASHPELYEDTGRPIDALIDECPKLRETLSILDDVRSREEKAVVFTRLKRMQQLLQLALAHRFGLHAHILNGDVQGSRRQEFVDRFNAAPGFGALILGPDATGVGLNIVGANHVIHYTRLWNPAKENQATDRVHRIGQKRPVTVYYPVVDGENHESVEQTLARLLEEKRALARDVVRPRESLSVEREMLQIFDLPEAA